MLFKLTVFLLILLAVAVLGVRGYRNATKRFEAGADDAGVAPNGEAAPTEERTWDMPPSAID